MNLTNYNKDLTIDDDSFVWRYMDFPKIQDLLLNNQMYFTRLDVFADPLEGMSTHDRYKLHLRNISKLEDESDPLKIIMKQYKDKFNLTKNAIGKWQEGIYASCWYLTEGTHNHHESLAMWDLYGDKYCFAIKMRFSQLFNLITEAVNELADEEVAESGYGKIAYLNLYEQMTLTSERVYPSLIKDRSFKHENEIRFLLLRDKIINKDKDRKGIKLSFKSNLNIADPKIEILCHPNMHSTVFDVFKPKFKEMGYELRYSALLTRSVVNALLEME